MSLVTNLQDFVTRIATEFKSVRAVTGSLTDLGTTTKASLVSAINEINSRSVSGGSGVAINDTTASTGSVFSSAKTNAQISSAVSGLVNSSPAALDTLAELATALGNDSNFASTTAIALGNRVRVDGAQGLTATQQAQARSNIGAASTANATESAVGLVEFGTTAEITTGTDASRAVSVLGLRTSMGDPAKNFVTTFETGLV